MKTRVLGVIVSCAALLAIQAQAQSVVLVNNSFEQPGAGKIKGWNGENAADIPGWATTTAAADSGVESDWPGHTDGVYSAFLMVGDPAVWQTTSHAIQSTDSFLLTVDARNNWSATGSASILLQLYYEVAGVKTVAASTIYTLTDPWSSYFLSFSAASLPACWGNNIGVALQNVAVSGSQSWLGMDNVQLSVVPEPGTLTFLGLGFLAMALRMRRTR